MRGAWSLSSGERLIHLVAPHLAPSPIPLYPPLPSIHPPTHPPTHPPHPPTRSHHRTLPISLPPFPNRYRITQSATTSTQPTIHPTQPTPLSRNSRAPPPPIPAPRRTRACPPRALSRRDLVPLHKVPQPSQLETRQPLNTPIPTSLHHTLITPIPTSLHHNSHPHSHPRTKWAPHPRASA